MDHDNLAFMKNMFLFLYVVLAGIPSFAAIINCDLSRYEDKQKKHPLQVEWDTPSQNNDDPIQISEYFGYNIYVNGVHKEAHGEHPKSYAPDAVSICADVNSTKICGTDRLIIIPPKEKDKIYSLEITCTITI